MSNATKEGKGKNIDVYTKYNQECLYVPILLMH